jgi:hypothetical protein
MHKALIYSLIVLLMGFWMHSIQALEWFGHVLKYSAISAIGISVTVFIADKTGLVKRLKEQFKK